MSTPFLFRALRYASLVSAIVLYTAGTARAQIAAVRPPTISRMCLWNADNATWRALGVKRDQVRHLNVIRQRYPAVVHGQWMNEADSTLADTPEAGHPTPIGSPPSSAQGMQRGTGMSNGPSRPGVRQEHIGLQAELREVLSDEQLRLWEERCSLRR